MGNEDSVVDGKGASPTPATPLSVRHSRRSERPCLMCHQRKICCDKKVPCSHCLRADVLCCYPAPERISRRPQKTTIAEVAVRLARLERTITAISNGASTQPDSALGPSHGSEAGTSESRNAGWPPDELLVQDGYSSRYINEALLSRVLEEVSLYFMLKRSGYLTIFARNKNFYHSWEVQVSIAAAEGNHHHSISEAYFSASTSP
jgi:hypothetical protein